MRLLFTLLLVLLTQSISAQDVMIQGWYWDYPKTADGHNWTDTLLNEVMDFKEAGITQVWLPPLSRASFGAGSNGYDPKDLYDLGEYGLGATGFGTRAQLDALIAALDAQGIESVADVVYNHRDGGSAEANPAVEGWVENYNCTKVDAGDQPFPSDRLRYVLPIGGSTGNGAGTYYFKVRSASKHPNFYNRPYTFYVETNTVGYQGATALNENEGDNGGGDCAQNFDVVPLGVDMLATVDDVGSCTGSCGIDEFGVTLTASDFNSAGDSLFIYMTNSNGNYSDHYISFIWNGSQNVQPDLIYETYTDFSALPSGQGGMNWTCFKPNGAATQLSGDWDYPYFFYDYDQNDATTQQVLTDWTQWLWSDVDIRGLRMDAVKHFAPEFIGNLLDSMHQSNMIPDMLVGEFFDFNAATLKNWVNSVEFHMDSGTKDSIDVKVFDFALRENLKNACDLFGYDARNVYNSGVVNGAGALASQSVTFVNNHDFRDGDQPVQNDPLLAYAYILTNRSVGTPCIFYPDFTGTTIPNSPTWEMRSDIKKLNAAYSAFIEGGSIDYLNRLSTPYAIQYISGVESASLIFQTSNGGSSGNEDAIVLINFAGTTLDVELPLSSGSSQPMGTLFSDITGKGLIPTAVTSSGNTIRLAVPARSYGVWVNSDTHAGCATDTLIYVDKNASGLNSGANWQDAYTSLSAALNQAKLCADIQEIRIKEGNYLPGILNARDQSFVLSNGITLRGGFPAAGAPELADYDPVLYPTVLSGDLGLAADASDNAYHVVRSSDAISTQLIGLIIEAGNADGSGADQSGAGVYNKHEMELLDCRIQNCAASGSGSGLLGDAGSTTIMDNCILENNSGPANEVLIKGAAVLTIKNDNTVKN